MLDVLTTHPWFLVALLAGFGIWAWSVWTVIRNPKFLRKLLWLLLTLGMLKLFTYAGDGWSISVGVPLGSLYILWFAKWGPKPTKARIEAARAKAEAAPADAAVKKLRIAYGVLLAASVTAGAWAQLVGFPSLLQADGMSAEEVQLTQMVGGGTLAVVAALIGLLIWRPAWWGKILCGLIAISWAFNGLVGGIFFGALTYSAALVLAALIAGAVGVYHHRVDPRFWGKAVSA